VSLTCDTSVLVASVAPWHPRHREALRAVEDVSALVPHVLVESYSVLTRLPDPHKLAPAVVGELVVALAAARPVLTLTADQQVALLAECARTGVPGGAVYDALIAVTARHHDAMLVTLDARARSTYDRIGVRLALL
jgi:predicted nucleic acid-binding protein